MGVLANQFDQCLAAQRVGEQIQYYYTGWRTNSDITSDQVKASQDLRGVVAAESTELRNAAASNQRVAEAAGAAAGATDGQTTATTAATTAIQLATTATQQQVAADKEAIQAKLTLSGSLIGLEGAFDDAMAAAKKNGKTLDINTAAGRANRTALDGIAASALTTKESLEKNHAGSNRPGWTVTVRPRTVRVRTRSASRRSWVSAPSLS